MRFRFTILKLTPRLFWRKSRVIGYLLEYGLP